MDHLRIALQLMLLDLTEIWRLALGARPNRAEQLSCPARSCSLLPSHFSHIQICPRTPHRRSAPFPLKFRKAALWKSSGIFKDRKHFAPAGRPRGG